MARGKSFNAETLKLYVQEGWHKTHDYRIENNPDAASLYAAGYGAAAAIFELLAHALGMDLDPGEEEE